jgi:hypothetical protein
MGDSLRWATTLGPLRDPRIHDWRDVVDRLKATKPRPTLARVLATVPAGGRVIVLSPIFRDFRGWRSEWTELVYKRSVQWQRLLAHDTRFRHVAHYRANEFELQRRFAKAVQADVYTRAE